jgi:hypothetical protein
MRSPTIKLAFGFVLIAIMLCLNVAREAPRAVAQPTAAPVAAERFVEAVDEDVADHITVPFFSFGGLTSKRSAPAL